jgi:hypothetical protein
MGIVPPNGAAPVQLFNGVSSNTPIPTSTVEDMPSPSTANMDDHAASGCTKKSVLLLDEIPEKPRVSRRRGSMSHFMLNGGNTRAWESVVKSITTTRLATIMLSGPHGCGKTFGVHELAQRHLGMSVYEINSSNVEGIEKFARDVRHVTTTKTLLGPRILLIDDLEGFDETYIAKAVDLLKERKEGDGPLIMTCHNIFDRSLVKLRPLELARIKLYQPRVRDMTNALKGLTNHSSGLIGQYAQECAGNFHQLMLRLKTHVQSRLDGHVGLFETTQDLLRGKADIDNWLRCGEPRILTSLLQENAMSIAQRGDAETELLRCMRFLDSVSATDAMPMDERMECVGRSAAIELCTEEVPLLNLSRLIGSSTVGRPLYERDIPSLLRGSLP